MHIVAWIVRIYSSTGKVILPSLNSSLLISNESVHPGISAWLDLKGQDDATFIYSGSETGWHGLMDDSALFSLTHRQPPPTIDVPWRALACWALLAFSYQSTSVLLDHSLQRDWHLCTPAVSASFFSAHTLHNDSVCSADGYQREKRASAILTVAFVDSDSWYLL